MSVIECINSAISLTIIYNTVLEFAHELFKIWISFKLALLIFYIIIKAVFMLNLTKKLKVEICLDIELVEKWEIQRFTMKQKVNKP